MDKYEYRVKTEQLLEYTEKKQYRKAMEIADTIDWRRVKSASMLNTVSEVYEYCGEFQKSRDILFMAFDRSPGSRKVVYRLATLALKVNDPDEASDCYEEFVKLAPKDPNQYILKYRILKVQKAPLEEQIAALEEFKKAEYIEKWAYELARLYHEAGMVRECLEECDDLILWFSEGKYVYLAMELKMKYKPLTPLQQEKYDKHTGKKTKDIVIPGKEEEEEAEEESTSETVNENTQEIPPVKEEAEEEEAITEESPAEEEEDEEKSEEVNNKPRAPITRIVTGATLEEALASGVAMAAGLNQEEKAMAERDEELKISGQMKIEDILQEWEEKQKVNADAIEKQKAEDKERLKKERKEAEKRKEASRRAAEEAARKAEEEAKKKAAEEAARKAEEEAKKKAAEDAARKAAEETARKAEEAAKKAEEARKKAAEEAEKVAANTSTAKKKAKGKKNILEEKTQKLPDDIMELVEQLESRVTGTTTPQKEEEEEFEQEDILEGLAEDFGAEEPVDLFEDGLQDDQAEEDDFIEEAEEVPEEDEPEEMEDDFGEEESDFEEEESEDFEDDFGEEEAEEDFEEDDTSEEDDFEEEESEDDFEDDDFEEEEPEDFEDDFEEEESEDFEDDFEEEDFEEEESEDFEDDFEEEDFEEEESEDFEDGFEEEDFEEEESEDFDDDFEDEEGDFEEEEFDEDEFIESEDDFDEEDFDEDDFEEEDFEEEESEDDFEEEDFEEEEFDEEDFEEDEIEEEEEISLEIEEPSEEEIQKRFKKAKGGGGVPFDTGFVVTGRYDLSATSEIGLKAGLTEEQKKLFSYFVPVRGMSEQIVEALDNDRRAQREGTSKTGNLLVIGRKGSGKTVLAVDIVKAIQKQRNLKQGKVAIVTGESLNKKELPNIIQKLKGGAAL